MARLHVVALLGLMVLILLGAWWVPGLATGPVLAVVAPWAVIEIGVLLALYARGEDQLGPRPRLALVYGQLILDLVGLTLFLHFAGGSENPFALFYVFPVIVASALLAPAAALAFAALATLLYWALLAAEGYGWLPHYSLAILHGASMYRSGAYLLGQGAALAATCILAGVATTTLMEALRSRARELAESRERAEGRAAELRSLNEELQGAYEEQRHSRQHLDELYLELQQAYNRLEVRSANMSELNEQLRLANAECKARREELVGVHAQMQEAYGRLEARSDHMRELNEQLRAANAECSRQREQLAKLNSQLVQANAKLSALEDARAQFTLLVTHELRAPVAAIQSYLKLIIDGYVKSDKVQETLEKAERRAMEQLALIADLLELGRIQSADARGKVEPVHIEQTLKEQVDSMAARAQERNIAIHIEVEPDLPAVLTNADQIRSVWNNLVSNAIKYNRDAGRVDIVLQREGDCLVGSVGDTGIGIPPEAMGRLFSEFFRADNAKAASRMGTGLGLSIVKEIIEHSGGRIVCESVLEKGTTFRFWLPVMAPEPQLAATEGPDRGAGKGAA
jgi:signal transduction histidine kinase/outer membrane murein-binding lipoprotein Lpp